MSSTIGALVTFSDLRESPIIAKKFPVIREMTGWVASVGIRNRATMVGNLCSAVPCCDSGAVLLVYDAACWWPAPKGKRKVPLREWFLGPRKTVLKRGEIATGVSGPAAEEETRGPASSSCAATRARTSRRPASPCWRWPATATASPSARSRRVRSLRNESKPSWKARRLSDDLIRQAVKLVPEEIAPITDIRATKEYRLHMVGVMLERGLRAAVARLAGTGRTTGPA